MRNANRTACILCLVGSLVLVTVIGCGVNAGSTPGGGSYVNFTVLGKTFTISFGDAGVINTRAGQTVNQAAAVTLFQARPQATPPNGQMTLASSNVGVATMLNKESVLHQASLTGSATVRFYIAAGASADLCSSAILLSEYQLNVVAGAVSIADEVYELSQQALEVVVANEVTICIEVTADFDGVITLGGFSLTFGGGDGGDGDEHDDGVPTGTSLEVPIDSEGQAVSPTATYNDIDYAIISVLESLTPDTPGQTKPSSVSVNLAALGLEYVERIYLGQMCAFVPDVSDSLIATMTCDYSEGGTPTTLQLRLGSNTAEWSYERPEHPQFGWVAHGRAPILYSWETNVDSASVYQGHVYSASLDLDTSRTLSRISLAIVDPAALPRGAVSPQPTWAAIGFVGITLTGPKGTPEGGGEPPSGETGAVSGQVVNALTGDPVAGAAVTIAGTTLSTMTDAGGDFTIDDVPVGGTDVVVTAAGFVESSTGVVVLSSAVASAQIGLVPLGEGGDLVTMVLAWGAAPRDLDLHMSGPDGAGGRFHAFYSNKNPVEHAFLDLDDRDGLGPETMTIRPATGGSFLAGEYHVWVHNFSTTPEFDASEARLTVTAGGAQLAQYDVSAGAGSPADDIWQVINLTVGADGSVTAVSVVQTFAAGSASSIF